jgi:DNA invertase Pin-like site-specific DNA recombinase
MTAFAYLRKSVVHDTDPDGRVLSAETQEREVIDLARRSNETLDPADIYSDMDKSGTLSREKRPGYDAFLRAIESGQATSVYAYSMSRFGRSITELAFIFDLCKRRGVPVRMVKDSIDTATASGQFSANVLMSMSVFEHDIAVERTSGAFQTKKARGDTDWGGRAYGVKRVRKDGVRVGDGEDAEAVVTAFLDAGSPFAAARLLNVRNVPTRNGKSRGWSSSAVRNVVKRLRPDLIVETIGTSKPVRGSKAGPRDHRFDRLMRCGTCGAMLSPRVDRGNVRYYCHANTSKPHGRMVVSERSLLGAFTAEANRAMIIARLHRDGSDADSTKAKSLDAARARWIEQYGEGLISKQARDAKLTAIEIVRSKLSASRWLKTISLPPDVASDAPAVVNAYLRKLLDHVTVDMSAPDRRGASPTATFVWRDETLRVENPDEDVDEEGRVRAGHEIA